MEGFCLYFMFCLILGVKGSIIRFQATPNDIKLGLANTLTLRCAVNDSAASTGIIGRRDVTQTSDNVAEVTSVILMKNGVDIAEVSHSKPAHLIGASSNNKVAGSVSSIPGEKGFIEMVIYNPTANETGEYGCEANALSENGHNVVFSTSLEVTASQPSIADVVTYLNDLRQQMVTQKDSMVIFSASLSHDITVLKGQNVVYDLVQANVGGGYNRTTGQFVCPTSGYYQIEMSALGFPNKNFWLNLMHNDVSVISIHGALTDYHGTSNSVALHLLHGDVLRVSAWENSVVHSNQPIDQVYTTFNGHLLLSD